VIHVGQLEGVCLLHVVWPVLGKAWCRESDGSIERDARVVVFVWFDVELAEPESDEPVERQDQRGLFPDAWPTLTLAARVRAEVTDQSSSADWGARWLRRQVEVGPMMGSHQRCR